MLAQVLVVKPSSLAAYYPLENSCVKFFCNSIFEVSHWFEQCNIQNVECARRRVLLWWLDEGTPQGDPTAVLRRALEQGLGQRCSCRC